MANAVGLLNSEVISVKQLGSGASAAEDMRHEAYTLGCCSSGKTTYKLAALAVILSNVQSFVKPQKSEFTINKISLAIRKYKTAR